MSLALSSLSMCAVLIDTTPPTAGTVLDGIPAEQDLAFSSCFSCATANWNGFQDTESGIDHYHVSIQLQPSGMPVYAEVFSVDIDSSHRTLSLSQFSFSTGDQVRVVVDAFNGAGTSTSVESSGVTIDLTPPTLTHLLIGPQSGSMGEHQYHSNASTLCVNWGVGDGESGVAEVQLSVLMVVEGIRIQIHPDPSSGERCVCVCVCMYCADVCLSECVCMCCVHVFTHNYVLVSVIHTYVHALE